MTDTFLLNDFYTINSIDVEDSKINATITLNASHPIFKGHFEQMPVVPGVCQTQIIKELLQKETNANLLLTKGDNIKFLGTIVPTQHLKIQLEIVYKQLENNYSVEAKFYYENITFTKFKGTFITN